MCLEELLGGLDLARLEEALLQALQCCPSSVQPEPLWDQAGYVIEPSGGHGARRDDPALGRATKARAAAAR